MVWYEIFFGTDCDDGAERDGEREGREGVRGGVC